MPKVNGILYGKFFMNGNEASAEGAIIAGCRFFGGYPITPSNQVAARMSKRLPEVGGVYLQFEDEIGSIVGIIGASCAGAKSMTATSGPGFSLMMENLGLAAILEVPIVIVNVMRAGPSTGIPTLVGQGDVMQARWGSHGDYGVIALSPNSPQEMLDLTIEAFNLAEKYRAPAIVLSDQTVGLMYGKVNIPHPDEVEIIDRPTPEEFDIKPSEYLPYDNKYLIPPMAIAGRGYRVHMTGLTHDERGYPTTDHNIAFNLNKRLIEKIERDAKKICRYEEVYTDDAEVIVISYGSASRSALEAIKIARNNGVKAGLFRLITVWPFPEWEIRRLADQVKGFITVEINMGQIYHAVREAVQGATKVYHLPYGPGDVHPPDLIYRKILEVNKE
jgi:2-oxoglutarate ferredoxin oxidoreductase subunit alpha